MRLSIRPRWPALALLLLAPGIPELLTGSTPVSELVYDPVGFLIGVAGIVGLYGAGALLIREFTVFFRKGWASILLLGAAYGIAEEGFAVHTFFQPKGSPVGLLGSYGHLFGVNWLWALGLTVFHATYSIALPILLVELAFPAARGRRWLDRGLVGVVAGVYLFVVVLFSLVVGHGPTPAALAFFLAVVAVLLGLAWLAPADLLSVRPGPRRIGRLGLVLAGTLEFDAWIGVLVLAATGTVPAIGAGALVVAADLGALALVVTRVGDQGLDRAKFDFAVGMLAVLFVWDIAVEFVVPGILAVSALFVYLLYRLHRSLRRRERSVVPAAVLGPPLG